MVRFFLAAIMALFVASETAFACSCIIQDEWKSAKREYQEAEVVFKGYLVTQQLKPLKYCNPHNVPSDTNHALGTFKVVQADKGATDGAVIVANLGGVFGARFVEGCELEQTGTSCSHEFYRALYGTEAEPVWFIMNFHHGALWDSSIGCTAFRSNADEIIKRYSKKDVR